MKKNKKARPPHKRALILFIRNPEKGKVKTRLARDLGEESALRIYRALLSHTREVCLQVRAHRLLFYSETLTRGDGWPESHFEKRVQSGDGLGARMQQAFEEALHLAEQVVIVGSDIAGLSPQIIENAFEQLEKNDYVIGPAIDGGYYLLGMKRNSPHLFQGIAWSTDQVFGQTTALIEQSGKSFALAPTLSDIDYAEDWEKYGWDID